MQATAITFAVKKFDICSVDFIIYYIIEQFPQTPIEEFRSSLFFFPPPTISWISLFVKSLPIEPVDGRPFEEIGKGGTEIVRLLGDTDPSVDPKN